MPYVCLSHSQCLQKMWSVCAPRVLVPFSMLTDDVVCVCPTCACPVFCLCPMCACPIFCLCPTCACLALACAPRVLVPYPMLTRINQTLYGEYDDELYSLYCMCIRASVLAYAGRALGKASPPVWVLRVCCASAVCVCLLRVCCIPKLCLASLTRVRVTRTHACAWACTHTHMHTHAQIRTRA